MQSFSFTEQTSASAEVWNVILLKFMFVFVSDLLFFYVSVIHNRCQWKIEYLMWFNHTVNNWEWVWINGHYIWIWYLFFNTAFHVLVECTKNVRIFIKFLHFTTYWIVAVWANYHFSFIGTKFWERILWWENAFVGTKQKKKIGFCLISYLPRWWYLSKYFPLDFINLSQ